MNLRHQLRQLGASLSRSRVPRNPRKRTHQLALEKLEDRLAPVVGAFAVPAAVAAGTGFDGVVFLSNTARSCSGSLLPTGRDVLTAAHCLTDGNGQIDTASTNVTFNLPGANITMSVPRADYFVHGAWRGTNNSFDNDIAILRLRNLAPSGPRGTGADRYDIYRATNELNQNTTFVGYGTTGTGNTGDSQASGTKRSGQNRFELRADQLIPSQRSNTGLAYDFDNGNSNNDLFGRRHGVSNTGLGANEAIQARGDSGGPAFLGTLIAGVSSYGGTYGGSEDVLAGLNRSFGELAVNTRVSTFASWIDSVIGGRHDLILDMTQQLVGQDANPDTIDVRRNGTFLDIIVNGQLYHRDVWRDVGRFIFRGSAASDTLTLPADLSLDFGVSVDGRGGTDRLVIYSRDNARTYTVTSTYVTITGAPTFTINYSNIEDLTVGAGATDRVNVWSTAAATPVTVVEAGTVTVGPQGQLDDIRGAVTITNPPRYTALTIDNSAGTTPQDSIVLLATGITGLARYASINWMANSLSSLTIRGSNRVNTYHILDTPRSSFLGLTTTLSLGTAVDTVNVLGTTSPLNVVGDGPNTTVNLGNPANGVQDIQGAVNLQNFGGRTTLNVDNTGDGSAHLTARQVLPGMGFDHILDLAPADIAYRGVQTGAVSIFLGGGANTFTVENTNTAADGNATTLTTGRGNAGNTVNVLRTTSPLNVVGGGPNTTVNLGNPSHGVQDIHGAVNLQIFAGGVRTTLVVDDSGNGSGTTASQVLPGDGFDHILDLAPAEIAYRGVQTGAVSIFLGGGANTFTVENTNTAADGNATTLTTGTGNALNTVNVLRTTSPLNVVSRGPNTTVNVGNAGSLGGILGTISVTNIGGLSTATLTIDDSADSFANRQVTLTSTAVTISGASLTTINYSAITSLTYNGGPGTDGFNVFAVEGTAAGTTTTLNGGGVADEFEVSPSGNDPNGLLGPLTIHGRPVSSSFLVYYDFSATVAQTYTLTANTISRTDAAPVTFDNLIQVVLLTAGVGSNTINVPSVAAGVIAAFNPANGDTITIGANQTLAAVQGTVEVNPTDNISANVVIDDSSNVTPPAGPITFSNDVTFGFTISGLAPAAIYLSARQNTTLNTGLVLGAGDKTFSVQAAPVGVALTLNAGGGTNTLDYTGYAGNVLANFQTAEFTGFSSAAHIQNVIGGQGANILVGDGNENLTGGTGQNLLISGGGSGRLTGGGAGDILIGGITAYDMDDASLQAILNYWTTSGDDYPTRVANLRAGSGVPQLEAGVTVFDGGAANMLTGNGNEAAGIFNLFYVTEAGTVNDPQPDEVIVDIDNPTPAATDQTRMKHGSAEFDPCFVCVPSVAHVNSSLFDQGNDPSSRLGSAKKTSWTPWED
jgi:hypothetical protein